MRLAPRTLFGRLMLVLAGGLVAAQLASIAINLQERDSLLVRSTGLRLAQRIADVVKVLDALPPAQREHVAAVLSVPPLILRLDRSPADLRDAGADAPHAAVFSAVLRAAIGEGHVVRVAMGAPRDLPPPRFAPPFAPGMPMMGGRGRFGAEGAWLVTQVRLHDGSWATFDTRVPESSLGVPWRLLATLGLLLVAVLVVSWIAVRLVTRPLKTLAAAAHALGGDLHRPPLPESGPAEVANAAHAFNAMQRRLVQSIEERVRVLAAMSHDLKTPITRMRLRAELLDDAQAREKFEADLREMEAMVTQSLEFLRDVAPRERKEPVDVMALLERIRADQAAMGRAVTVSGEATQPVLAMPSLLKRCVSNLVDNAVLYGGRADIDARSTAAGIAIRVRDPGPGIPEGEQERVFEPFYRLEASRNRATGGTGLGLAISRNIARAHGGDVRLRNHPEGGLEAIVELPGR